MPPPHTFSAIWSSEKRFNHRSEHGKDASIKPLRNGCEKRRGILVLQCSQTHQLQLQAKSRKVWLAGFLLISLAAFHYIYFGAISLSKFTNSNSQDQIPTLHFSMPTGKHN